MPGAGSEVARRGWTLGDTAGGYYDPTSGRLFVVARPAARPDLWSAYLAGARRSYRQHGVEEVVGFDQVRDGASTSMFIAVVEDDGRVVGGLRVQGPYRRVEQAAAIGEWAGRAGSAQLRGEIARRLADGVIEVKAVWVERGISRHGEVTAAVARSFIHCLQLMNVRYAMCTAATHSVARWQSSGGRVSAAVAAVAYPDARYQTHLLWWDRATAGRRLTWDQRCAVAAEWRQMLRPGAGAPSPARLAG